MKSMCDVAERLEKKGIEKGFEKGIEKEIIASVLEGDYSLERGAEKLNISVNEFEKKLEENDYVNITNVNKSI